MDEYYCPNCGSNLGEQSGFDPDGGTWRCRECGQLLMDEDVYEGDTYEGVAWYCDDCGSLLNRQSGFSDSCGTWRCRECGFVNGITEDDIYESEEDYQRCKPYSCNNEDEEDVYDSNDDEIDDEGDIETNNTLYSNKAVISASRLKKKEEKQKKYEKKVAEYNRKQKERKKFKRTIKMSIAIFVILLGIFYYIGNVVEIGYDSHELIGIKYSEVKELFEKEGFTNIEVLEIADLPLSKENDSYEVTKVILDDEIEEFNKNDKYFKGSKVTIVYHTIKLLEPPISNKDAKGNQYADIVDLFEKAGFSNVTTKVEYDIYLNVLKKKGEVESVSIDGKTKFGSSYRPDAKVVITYHDLHKNKLD